MNDSCSQNPGSGVSSRDGGSFSRLQPFVLGDCGVDLPRVLDWDLPVPVSGPAGRVVAEGVCGGQ